MDQLIICTVLAIEAVTALLIVGFVTALVLSARSL